MAVARVVCCTPLLYHRQLTWEDLRVAAQDEYFFEELRLVDLSAQRYGPHGPDRDRAVTDHLNARAREGWELVSTLAGGQAHPQNLSFVWRRKRDHRTL